MTGINRFLGKTGLLVAGLLLWLTPEASAQFRWLCRPRPDCPQEFLKPPTEVIPPVDPKDPKDPKDKKDPKDAPPREPFLAPVTTAALGDSTTSVPHMMGDFFGYCGLRIVRFPVTITTTTVPPPPVSPPPLPNIVSTALGFRNVIVCDPIASRAGSGFKIADNASPIPLDRVFFTYNYFDTLRGHGGFLAASNNTVNGPNGQVTTAIPEAFVPGRTINVHRELFGFEKTFLDGNASVEVRLPVFQNRTSDVGFAGDSFGDVSVILKYTLYYDRQTGNAFSTGIGITAPTGPAIETIDGNINSTLLQPYVGYVRRFGDFYVEGFHSLVIPTNTKDATILFNDVGAGYILRPSGNPLLAFIAPNVEAHVTTPLDHRNGAGAVILSDLVTLTGGIHFGLGDGRSILTFGVATPVTGPRPMNLEAFLQFNFRF